MTNEKLIDAVRTLHNTLFKTSDRYRKLLSTTPHSTMEGLVSTDEYHALHIMREVAVATGNAVVAVQKLDQLSTALHVVLLADGLGGSLAAAQEHVAYVQAELREEKFLAETQMTLEEAAREH
jgi:hypothetical protein